MSIKENFIKIIRRFPCLYQLLKWIHGMLSHFKLWVKRINRYAPFTHMYNVKEIVMQQNRKEGYNRLDIIVRLLAIENEYGLNDYGWELYRKMQERRVGKETLSINDRVRIFKELIYLWETNGYNNESLILVDNSLMLVDGSHRLALAIYHGLDKINCKVLPANNNIVYGVEWFIENGFTEQEVKLILDKADGVIDANKIIILCILWPPVKKYFDEIVGKLSLVYKVLETKDMSFSNETFDRFVQAVYQIDDIEQWKIDKKIQYMAEVPEKVVRLVVLEFDTPQFRYKDLNHNCILTQGEQIKKMIRNCYKEKINNYFYDIICHTGDNQEQSEYIMKLFYPAFSPYEYFEKIGGGRWIIIKLESANLPTDFPESFPFSKDIDILCDKEDFKEMIGRSVAFFTEKCKRYYDEPIVIREDSTRCRIRIELEGYLIFQIDLCCSLKGLSGEFINDSLSRRIKQYNYYIPNKSDEICFRINEFIAYPEKVQHLEFVRNHAGDVDKELVIKNISGAKQVLERII